MSIAASKPLLLWLTDCQLENHYREISCSLMPALFNVKRLMRPIATQLAQLFFACIPYFLPRPSL